MYISPGTMEGVLKMLNTLKKYPDAYKKLSIIANGVCADGNKLASSLIGYPEKYKTKRRDKCTRLVNGKMYDTGAENSPYVPQELILFFENERKSIVKFNYKENSPVKLMISDNNRDLYLLHSTENWTLPVEIPFCNDSDNYVSVLGIDRAAIMGYQGCSGWLLKKQCLFCDNVALRRGEQSIIPNLNDLPDLNKDTVQCWLKNLTPRYAKCIAESCKKILPSIKPHCHLVFMSGNLPYNDLIWQYHLDLIQKITEDFPLDKYETYLNLLPPPDRKMLQEAKDAGIKKVIFNMEVWGEDYRFVCREKNDLIPMPVFLERLKDSVDIFGKGNVYCGFVLGAQPIERLREGCKYLTEMGVSCNMTVFTPKRGTPWENKPVLPLESVADFSLFLAGQLNKHELSPLYCRLSSRSEVIWEIFEDMINER